MGYGRFLAKKAAFLLVTLVAALYLTVVISNFGGYLGDILKAQIAFEETRGCLQDPVCVKLPLDLRNATIADNIQAAYDRRGLNEPFLQRSIRYTIDLLFFQLGDATVITSGDGSRDVTVIVMERLPRTVLLFTTGAMIAAALGIWLGLWMARKALTPFDRGLTVLSITTTVVPTWVFAILLILVAFAWPVFPSGGMLSVPAPKDPLAYAADVLWHMTLPLVAVVLSTFGAWSYTTRNLVLQIMDEDYVYAARAKGLPDKIVNRRYVLRAASPPVVTALALTIIASWQGAIITETVFNWPGLGLLFFVAISALDAPVIIGLTAIYAYLLVLTVFVLDLIYGLLDPRVKALRR